MKFYTLSTDVLCKVDLRSFKTYVNNHIEELVDTIKYRLREEMVDEVIPYSDRELYDEFQGFLEDCFEELLRSIDDDLIGSDDKNELSKESLKLLLESIPGVLASEYLDDKTADFVIPEDGQIEELYSSCEALEDAFHETHSYKYASKLANMFNEEYLFDFEGLSVTNVLQPWDINQAIYFEIDANIKHHAK